MRILRRYFISEFLKAFLVVAGGVSFMLGAVQLIQNFDQLVAKPALDYLLYVLYLMPQNIVYSMPIAGLFAGLFTVGQAVRNRETTAVMSAGGRLRTLFLPLVAAGLVFSFAGFALGEFVAPPGLRAAQTMTAGKQESLFKQGTMWVRAEDGSLVRLNLYIRGARGSNPLAQGVSIFLFKNGQLCERIEARNAVYKEGGWTLSDVRIYNLEKGSAGTLAVMRSPLVAPKLLDKESRSPAEMGMIELYSYSKKLREAGIRNLNLVVDLNARLSYPLINFFMVLLAIAISVRRGFGGLASAGVGVALSLFYWLSYTACLSLGYAGIVQPAVSAWLVPFGFAVVSVKLFNGIKE